MLNKTSLFQKHKGFLGFLVRFFGVYLLLTLLYQGWLYGRTDVDPITRMVGQSATVLLQWTGFEARLVPAPTRMYDRLFFEGNYVARIIEGCNAVSIMILFVAFVVAFYSTWRRTLLFCIIGILIIHLLNIIRIGLLAYLLKEYPQHEHFLHGTVFPLFIYSVVFSLWILWVQRLSGFNHGKK